MKLLKPLIIFLAPIAAVVGGKELFEWMGGVPDMSVIGLLLIFVIICGISLAIGSFIFEERNKKE